MNIRVQFAIFLVPLNYLTQFITSEHVRNKLCQKQPTVWVSCPDQVSYLILLVSPRLLKSCYNTYVLSSLEYCAPVWMFSEESQLEVLDSVVRSTERLCGGEL